MPLSPLVGFAFVALLLLALKSLVKNKAVHHEPNGNTPSPWSIRRLLVLTCTGLSFAHGSNDGQKGIGPIMLILAGTVPVAYALNRAMPVEPRVPFVALAQSTHHALADSYPMRHGRTRAGHSLTLCERIGSLRTWCLASAQSPVATNAGSRDACWRPS